MRRFIAALLITGCMVVLTGCPGGNDASVKGRDHGPAEAINFPDHFSSVATKCNHGNRVYVADHSDTKQPSAVAVVAHDPSCP